MEHFLVLQKRILSKMSFPNPRQIAGATIFSLISSGSAYAAQVQETTSSPNIELFGDRVLREYNITVEQGDTLSGIAQKIDGCRTRDSAVFQIMWNDLYKQNRTIIEDPNKIYIGQILMYSCMERMHHGIDMTL